MKWVDERTGSTSYSPGISACWISAIVDGLLDFLLFMDDSFDDKKTDNSLSFVKTLSSWRLGTKKKLLVQIASWANQCRRALCIKRAMLWFDVQDLVQGNHK